jgi:hypothetical protein
MSETTKRHLISAIVTFVAGFAASIAVQLQQGIPAEITSALIVGIILSAFRAGVKGAFESLMRLMTGDKL